jgi:hypothetical protein
MTNDLSRLIQIPRKAQPPGVNALFHEWFTFQPINLPPPSTSSPNPNFLSFEFEQIRSDKSRYLQFYSDFLKTAEVYGAPSRLISAVNALKNSVIFDAEDLSPLLTFISTELKSFSSARPQITVQRSPPPQAPQPKERNRPNVVPPPPRSPPPKRQPQGNPFNPTPLTAVEDVPRSLSRGSSRGSDSSRELDVFLNLIDLLNSFTNGVFEDPQRRKIQQTVTECLDKVVDRDKKDYLSDFQRNLKDRKIVPFQMIVEYRKLLAQ